MRDMSSDWSLGCQRGVRRPRRGYLLVTLALLVVARGGLGLSDEAAAG
jgi:hypothetical protein